MSTATKPMVPRTAALIQPACQGACQTTIAPLAIDEIAMPTPTPQKCSAWRSLRLASERWPNTIVLRKIIMKALATPARNRMTTKAARLSVMAISARRTAVAPTPASINARSRPCAQPPEASSAPTR